MVKLNLNKENEFTTAGTADTRFADHSGKIQQGYQLGSLTEGLVAYYPMEKGEGKVLLDGATGNHGQIDGASWTNGNIGNNALDFDGSSDVRITKISTSPKYTISAWVNLDKLPSTAGNNMAVFSTLNDGDKDGKLLKINSSDDKFNADTGDGSTYDGARGGPTLTTDTWYHGVATYDGNKARLYVNGMLEATKSIGYQQSTDAAFVGNEREFNDYLEGSINDLRIYDRALSQPEIQALYNFTQPSGYKVKEKDLPTKQAPPSMQDESAVARYEFNGNVTDSWGNNDGTDNTSAGYVDGVYGQAKDFDGSDDVITGIRPSLIADGNGSGVSFTYWLKPEFDTTSTTDMSVFRIAIDSSNNTGAAWGGNADTTNFTFEWSDDRLHYSFSQNYRDNWIFMALTSNGASTVTNKIYLNGKLVKTGGVNGTQTMDLTSGTWSEDKIGEWNAIGGQNIDGLIDDFRAYDRELKPCEIEKLYNKGAYRIKRGEI